jgi:hypothetical protein
MAGIEVCQQRREGYAMTEKELNDIFEVVLCIMIAIGLASVAALLGKA